MMGVGLSGGGVRGGVGRVGGGGGVVAVLVSGRGLGGTECHA